jgi:hypothetical protein
MLLDRLAKKQAGRGGFFPKGTEPSAGTQSWVNLRPTLGGSTTPASEGLPVAADIPPSVIQETTFLCHRRAQILAHAAGKMCHQLSRAFP